MEEAAATTTTTKHGDALALDMRAATDAHDAEQLLRAKTHSLQQLPAVDAKKNRFPFCIVWSPIPVITWLLPFIGHLGIATSDGYVRAAVQLVGG